MKNFKLLLTSALVASATSLAFAGPGIEYWTRLSKAEKDRAEAKAQAAAPTKAPAPTPPAACGNCGCGNSATPQKS